MKVCTDGARSGADAAAEGDVDSLAEGAAAVPAGIGAPAVRNDVPLHALVMTSTAATAASRRIVNTPRNAMVAESDGSGEGGSRGVATAFSP